VPCDAREHHAVTGQRLDVPVISGFSHAKCEKTPANGVFSRTKNRYQKVVAHETFAEVLRLYM
jgi:hypothetical protein